MRTSSCMSETSKSRTGVSKGDLESLSLTVRNPWRKSEGVARSRKELSIFTHSTKNPHYCIHNIHTQGTITKNLQTYEHQINSERNGEKNSSISAKSIYRIMILSQNRKRVRERYQQQCRIIWSSIHTPPPATDIPLSLSLTNLYSQFFLNKYDSLLFTIAYSPVSVWTFYKNSYTEVKPRLKEA